MAIDDLLRLIEHRLDVYNRHYRFDFFGVKIKNMKSRWGSKKVLGAGGANRAGLESVAQRIAIDSAYYRFIIRSWIKKQ